MDEQDLVPRIDMRGFAADMATMRAELSRGLGDAAELGARTIEGSLLRAARTGKFGFEELKATALSVLDQIARAALRQGVGSPGMARDCSICWAAWCRACPAARPADRYRPTAPIWSASGDPKSLCRPAVGGSRRCAPAVAHARCGSRSRSMPGRVRRAACCNAPAAGGAGGARRAGRGLRGGAYAMVSA